MFTLEIAGRPIAITDADEDQAQELFKSQDFKDDLRSFESDGRPLWDGTTALQIRRSSDAEIEAFDQAVGDDDEDDEADEEPGINVLFLVRINGTDDQADSG